MSDTTVPVDGTWTGVVALREAARGFDRVTHGFSKKQKDSYAVLYFSAIALGAKLAGDDGLDLVVRSWIASTLRPLGYALAVESLGMTREGNAEQAGHTDRQDGAADSAA